MPSCLLGTDGDPGFAANLRFVTQGTLPTATVSKDELERDHHPSHQREHHQQTRHKKMGEQPIYSARAHVFHIDPQTKRSWLPASSTAVNVNFFYDSARNLYRIISVEGNKAVINSTITPNMTFTKTSQKFGQWSDIRANTVYGLGFASEGDLNKFIDKFQEIKEATRREAQHKSSTDRSSHHTNGTGTLPRSANLNHNDYNNDSVYKNNNNNLGHQRSQSLSHLQANKMNDSPSRSLSRDGKTGSTVMYPSSSTEAQLRYENDRLKLALAQSSANAKKWEIELLTLKNNNTRLTSALQESTSNVEEWKRQLQALKEENERMRQTVLEHEAATGNPEALSEIRKEVMHLRVRAEALEADVKQKDKEIDQLKERLEEQANIYSSTVKSEDKLKILLQENDNLRSQLTRLSDACDGRSPDKARKVMLDQLNHRLAQNVHELRSIHKELDNLLNTT